MKRSICTVVMIGIIVYDEFSFYLAEDTEKKSGYPYVYIGGRIVVNDGTTITQYIKNSD